MHRADFLSSEQAGSLAVFPHNSNSLDILDSHVLLQIIYAPGLSRNHGAGAGKDLALMSFVYSGLFLVIFHLAKETLQM